ncbi:YflT domain-containing protein [Paenibacillus pini]|uniref:General stress protein 17M n=1 Tax=Paenibacillus pini JCM 16418 TaxID=1236976 RepID=W7YR16_9BACL|nr:general stress protein [Paenibacillus pini]GAF09873.1 general stress protein 17M [Paenibacillus pini JCM 16418]
MENNMTSMTKVQTVNSAGDVRAQVNKFMSEGYNEDRIFVLAHDKDRTDRVAEQTNTEQIGMNEEGVGTAIANIFRSRGDELRAKMRSMGISEEEANRLEEEMDTNKIVVIAWGGKEFNNDDFDSTITYYPYMII